MEQWDKDPGDLAGDLGRLLRGAGKEGEGKALMRRARWQAGESGRERRGEVGRARIVRLRAERSRASGPSAAGPQRGEGGELGLGGAGRAGRTGKRRVQAGLG